MAPRRSSQAFFGNKYSSEIIRWKSGDTSKPNPFFILVINNIALERPLGSNNFVADMSTGTSKDRALFAGVAEYIGQNIFGKMANQAESLLSASPHNGKIRFWSIYVWGLEPNGAPCLVGEDGTPGSTIIIPRRNAVVGMLAYIGLNPDIVFLVTKSRTHNRASAYGTTDDDARGGIPAAYDGRTITHRFYHTIPGMAAIHTRSTTMTAAHEFGHAFSSYTNGFATDLYVDGGVEFNRKVGRPIPVNFATYQPVTYLSDKTRDSLGYAADWNSYHSELADPARPALMDNFWLASGGPMLSLHDKMTKAYILDRVAAKVSR